jgi:hypothetical protein
MKTPRWILALVALLPGLAAAQTVTLTATPASGVGSVSPTLTWSTSGFPIGATVTCTAGGAWSGAKAASGSQTLAAITANATYTLTCSGGTTPATVSWTPPTQNEDGSALTNLANYKLFVASSAAGVPSATPTTFAAPASSYVVTGLAAGTWYFGVRSVNSAGVESVMSNVASKAITAITATASADVTVTPRPNPPSNVTVAVVTGLNMAPVYSVTSANKLSALMGFADLGVSCGDVVLVRYRGHEFREVARADVKWWGSTSLRVAAPCGAPGVQVG